MIMARRRLMVAPDKPTWPLVLIAMILEATALNLLPFLSYILLSSMWVVMHTTNLARGRRLTIGELSGIIFIILAGLLAITFGGQQHELTSTEITALYDIRYFG
jgi:hypothetical protein